MKFTTHHIFIFLCLFFNPSLHASLIDRGCYIYDDVTGFSWLDLALTDGLSIFEAQELYPHLEVASGEEFERLIANLTTDNPDAFDGVNGYFNWDDTGFPFSLTSLSNTTNFSTNDFQSAFGITNFELGGVAGLWSNSHGIVVSETGAAGTVGVSTYEGAIDLDFNMGYEIFIQYLEYPDNPDPWYTGQAGVSVFLMTTSSVVPEPSIFALMGIGLVFLGFRVSHKKTKAFT